MSHLDGKGPNGIGLKTGRSLGFCVEISDNKALNKLGKGLAKKRKSGGGNGMGKRFKSGLNL